MDIERMRNRVDAIKASVNAYLIRYKKDGTIKSQGLHDAEIILSRKENALAIRDLKSNVMMVVRYDTLLEILMKSSVVMEDENVTRV